MKKKKVGAIILLLIVLLVVGVLAFVVVKKNFFPSTYYNKTELAIIEALMVKMPALEYGIPVDLFNIEAGVINNGQIPASLFRSLGAPNSIINQLILLPVDTFDLRKLKAGNIYKAFYSVDSNALSYFVYELSATDYAIFDLRDTLKVKFNKKPVTVVRKTGTASINSSLWNAVVDNNMNLLIAFELSDIYAWSIDFFGLQKDDSFDVIYDELYVDSTSVGIGQVHAARFKHLGKPYYAIHFHKDTIAGYWNDKGENLKKAFLKAPLKFSRISSGFTYARKHPILKTVRAHTGVDYAAPAGTPVMSIGQGTVIEKGYKGGGGHTVKIRHNSVYSTAYLHLSKYGKDIAVGTRVNQGQVIGYVGSTGLSTGPHLDFRVWKSNKPINPLTMESPPADSITPALQPSFDSIRTVLLQELEAITPN